jgi:hypothetical protein
MDDEGPFGEIRSFTHSLVLTQDCDLEQDHAARFPADGEASNSQDKLLLGLILCGVYAADAVRAGTYRNGANAISRKEWTMVEQNRSPRYQYLGYVKQAESKLVADFKDFFLVPTAYLYSRIASRKTKRLATMCTPYPQHAQQRFAWYLMRVGLPLDLHRIPVPSVPAP